MLEWTWFYESRYVPLCAISYHLNSLKNVKNVHEGVLLLVKLLKVTFLHGCFHVFEILEMASNRKRHHKACNFTKSNTSRVFFNVFEIV